MAYIFRLHPNGQNTNTDWQPCQPYGQNVISQIVAPNGATARTEITSIPSPFARIALVKTAFSEVVKSGNLNGNTIYHKMVSDSLDVAEIFFNYEKLNASGKIFDIITWDTQSDLSALQRSHPQVFHSLDIFLKQDAAVYHFDRMNRLYILVYVGTGRKSQMDVVGATSPATMFFTPANDLSYISQQVSFGQDHPFDGQFQPLHARDPQLVQYLFAFRQCYNGVFAADFPEVDAYLTQTFAALPPQVQNTVAALTSNSLNGYLPLQVGGNTVEVLGNPLHLKPMQQVRNSDFEIAQSHYSGGVFPLVLPVEPGNTYANYFYVQAPWGSKNVAPCSDTTPWQQRSLPHDGTRHPYLTIGDLLEDTLLLYPRKASDSAFFFANWNCAADSSPVLPLKPLFFELFTVGQLLGGVNGNPMLTLSTINKNDVQATLTIPVRGGQLTYTRNYYHNAQPDPSRNRGAIKTIPSDFGLAMLPLVQTPTPFYRIAITHDFSDTNSYKLEGYSNGAVVNLDEVVRNKSDQDYLKTHVFVCDNGPLDSLRLGVGQAQGMIVPRFLTARRNQTFIFAVDFGTTNTHIEYSDGKTPAEVFQSQQIVLWAECSGRTEDAFETNLLPIEIGQNMGFPTRTALSESADTDWNAPVTPMADTNIPLTYNHRVQHDYNNIITDLKWGNNADNITRVRSYIENLMLLMRNKVLIEGGNLQGTKIVWFYPGAMTTARRNSYEKVWTYAYQKYFGGTTDNVVSVLESVAPYEYYRRIQPAASRMVSIDIGGGTSDVVIAEKGTILYTTSFRFAANSIFGNGYSAPSPYNGMVDCYGTELLKRLKSSNIETLPDVLEKRLKTGVASDIASLYFALASDDEVKEKNATDMLDWNAMLQNDDRFRIVFLLFYAAVIYHIAHIMHAKGLQMPRHIAFSGNGSRVVSVLSSSNKTLAEYTKDIFCRVYGVDNYHPDGLDIILNGEPKVATCKGGIAMVQNNQLDIATGEKLILKNAHTETFFGNDTYKDVDEQAGRETVQDVEDFLHFVLDGNSRFSLKNNFGITQQDTLQAMEVCKKDLLTFFDNGLEQKKQECAPSDPVEEPLFFYPVVGMLYSLSDIIYANNKQS